MKNQKGQVLLIAVMFLATVMTVVLSTSFKSTTDTQVTKLEEESQKALAAAESAIEVALKENSTTTIGSGSLDSITGFSGTATIDTTTSTRFTTPLITKDGSHTFYLGNYDLATKVIGPSTSQDIVICFESGTPNPALEVTLIKLNGVTKYAIDPSSRIAGASATVPCAVDTVNYSHSATIPSSNIGIDGQFLLVRVLYNSSKLLFSGSSNLPVQGRTVSSQATSSTSTGVSKKVVLFQSHPQIPGEFFTTTF